MLHFKTKSSSPLKARLLAWSAVFCVYFLLTASGARAVPVVHNIVGGFVDIDVKLNGVVIGSAPNVGLTGGSVTVDAAALTLDAIRIEINPDPGQEIAISLSTPFGGYDEITVEEAVIEGDVSFATSSSIGVPSLFTAVAGTLTVDGSWGATDSSGTNPDTSGNLISFPVLSLIAIVNQNPFVEIDQVTINSIDGTPFGEAGKHLTIVASYTVLAPEPGTGLLFALGLTALAWRRRPRSGNASRL